MLSKGSVEFVMFALFDAFIVESVMFKVESVMFIVESVMFIVELVVVAFDTLLALELVVLINILQVVN